MGSTLRIIRFTFSKWVKRFTSLKKRKDNSYIYLTVEEVIQFNIKVTGIQGQLRDAGGLESAIMRPQMAGYYNGADIVTQAALLTDGICMAHAFNDGNKRTALIVCITFLEINHCKLKRATGQIGKEIEALVLTRDIEHFTKWLREHVQSL